MLVNLSLKFTMLKFGQAIKIPNKTYAYQAPSLEARKVKNAVFNGDPVYRVGNTAKSKAPEHVQYWVTEPSITPNYAAKFGIPPANVDTIDFAIAGRVKSDAPFITRNATGVGRNPGGGIEVVTNPGQVEFLDSKMAIAPQIMGNRSILMQGFDHFITTAASGPVLGGLTVEQKQITKNKLE